MIQVLWPESPMRMPRQTLRAPSASPRAEPDADAPLCKCVRCKTDHMPSRHRGQHAAGLAHQHDGARHVPDVIAERPSSRQTAPPPARAMFMPSSRCAARERTSAARNRRPPARVFPGPRQIRAESRRQQGSAEVSVWLTCSRRRTPAQAPVSSAAQNSSRATAPAPRPPPARRPPAGRLRHSTADNRT